MENMSEEFLNGFRFSTNSRLTLIIEQTNQSTSVQINP